MASTCQATCPKDCRTPQPNLPETPNPPPQSTASQGASHSYKSLLALPPNSNNNGSCTQRRASKHGVGRGAPSGPGATPMATTKHARALSCRTDNGQNTVGTPCRQRAATWPHSTGSPAAQQTADSLHSRCRREQERTQKYGLREGGRRHFVPRTATQKHTKRTRTHTLWQGKDPAKSCCSCCGRNARLGRRLALLLSDHTLVLSGASKLMHHCPQHESYNLPAQFYPVRIALPCITAPS